MSIRILSPILRDQRYEGKQKLILVALADMVNDEGIGFASYRQIREIAGVSDEYIRQSVAKFVEDGAVAIVQKGSGPGKATVYRIIMGGNDSPTQLGDSDELPNSVVGNSPTGDPKLPNSTLISSLEAPSLEAPSKDLSPADAGDKPNYGALFADLWKQIHGQAAPNQAIKRVARDSAILQKEGTSHEVVARAIEIAVEEGHSNIASAVLRAQSQRTARNRYDKPSTATLREQERAERLARYVAEDAAERRVLEA